MVGTERRAEIRKQYRAFRVKVDKTQLEIEALARLDTGRYWKIENGIIFPTPEERERLARIFKINEADIPSEQIEARAS